MCLKCCSFYGIPERRKTLKSNAILSFKISVKSKCNNLNNDVNSKHLIEHALSSTLERVDKDGRIWVV